MQDFYNLDYIKQFLDVPGYRVHGVDLRVFSVMGDRIAAALLKALYPITQVDEGKLKKILAAVSAAFGDLNSIDNYPDRIPAVTLCLLETLIARAKSSQQKDWIRSVMDEVKTVH